MAISNLKVNRYILSLVLVFGLLISNFAIQGASAACSALPTDRGNVTATVNIQTTGTYSVWSRIKTDTPANNSFYMQIDDTMCNTSIGGSSLTANTWTWVNYKDGNSASKVTMNFTTTGNHTVKLAGKDDNVMLDRIIFTQDSSCVPVGTGDNCSDPAPVDTTPPVVSSIATSNITQTSATVTWTTDESSDSKVNYGTTTSYGANKSSASMVTTHSVNVTGLTAGTTYHYQVVSTDASSNTATSSDKTFTTTAAADTTPPVITSISSSSITQTSATVTWTTDESSDSKVNYGTTTGYGNNKSDASMVTSHSVNITGLTANTTYNFQVVSNDASSNTATSSNNTFKTLAPAADTTKPTVSITAPSAGNVSNTVTVTANAADNVGVVGVQFKLDGNNLNAEDTSSPYSTSWNTKTASNGSHTLTAIARDAAGNVQTSSSVVVTVNNATFIAEDINQDGKVDILDFSILSANYGKKGGAISPARADVNGDGTVDILDFSRLSSKFGK